MCDHSFEISIKFVSFKCFFNVVFQHPQVTKISAKPPHGDCVQIDEEMNRQMIFFADMFSYTQYQCRETVSQAVSSRVTSRCTSEFPFPIPCNPHNLTQLLGKNLNEIHNDSDYFLIVRTLQMQCPRPCAAQSYDVKHTTSKNVFKGIERLVQGGVLEPPEN